MYLTHEEKVILANSKVEPLEAKSSRLRKDLISVMEERNTKGITLKVSIVVVKC